MKILILGYGNHGRQDDGLGPALVAELEKHALSGITLDSDYQLNIEYAVDLLKHDIVIFADASLKGEGPYEFHELKPSYDYGVSTHSLTAESLLGLTMDLMSTPPKAYLLAIRGYSFDIAEGISERAAGNLDSAVGFILEFIKQQTGEGL
jgi:hydrogenase maturation protease